MKGLCCCERERRSSVIPKEKVHFWPPKKSFTTSGSVGGSWVFFGAGTEDFSRWVFVAVKIWGDQKLDPFFKPLQENLVTAQKKSHIVYSSWRCFFPLHPVWKRSLLVKNGVFFIFPPQTKKTRWKKEWTVNMTLEKKMFGKHPLQDNES